MGIWINQDLCEFVKSQVISIWPNKKVKYTCVPTRNTILDKGLKLEEFCDYLLNNVIIMRIPVPRDTELNHYFEIMNSRGEQLEKHEVLKASLMDSLDASCHLLFNDIWEACSTLSSYVQMNFKPKVRSLIFSENWADLKHYEFDTLNNLYSHLGDDDDIEGLSARGWCAYTTRGNTRADALATSLYTAAQAHLPGQRLSTDYTDADPDLEKDFYLLRHTLAPAVLVENMFMDNVEDAAFLLSKEGQQSLINLHVDGICTYLANC